MKLIEVVKSERPAKKWKAVFEDDDGSRITTHFGAAKMNDFTLTNDTEARARYWKRHTKDLKTNDPTRAGFLSLFLLWNKPTLRGSITDYKKRFDL
jgi:hypothetical protein